MLRALVSCAALGLALLGGGGHAPSVASAPIDVAALPLGPPPDAVFLGGGVVHLAGRNVATDYAADDVEPTLLGTVDGRLIVTSYVVAGRRSGDRFWAIDATGHAEPLGGSYSSYDYLPQLVKETGHLWVHYSDRTSPRTLWEIDARTGRELAVYRRNAVPRGLAPADQALVDAWVARRAVRATPEDRTRDGSLLTRVRSVLVGDGYVDVAVVYRSSDRSVVTRFPFRVNRYDGASSVVFEDADHVLVLVTVSFTRRHGPQQAVVRCSISTGSCERATEIGGVMTLGVTRPRFFPVGSPGEFSGRGGQALP